MIRPPLLSLLRRSVAGSRRGPASSTTTDAPRAVSSHAARLPQAPAPTMTTSARDCMWGQQAPVYLMALTGHAPGPAIGRDGVESSGSECYRASLPFGHGHSGISWRAITMKRMLFPLLVIAACPLLAASAQTPPGPP